MKASEFVVEKKKRKRRSRWASYGPGPYGGYGYATGYSGDSGSEGGDGGGESIEHEASYPGNIGMMELAKFFSMADEEQKTVFKQLLERGKKGLAWKLVQDIVGVKLQGSEFAENFADGKNPQDKGDSKRHGIPTKASLSSLDKVGRGSGRKAQLARWQANMRRGRAK